MTDEEKKKAEEDAAKAELAKAAQQAGGGKTPSAPAIARAIGGLQFRTNKEIPVLDDSTGKPVKENGKPKMRYVPDSRPMTAGDVLNAYYADGQLVIVSKDGSKYRSATGK